MIFEDSHAGVSAGVAAGCDVVAIHHSFNGNNDLSQSIKQISSYQELLV